jgi:hypothetical protein
MFDKIISTIITFVVSGALGYCVKVIKEYKSKKEQCDKNNEVQNQALVMMLQSSLTNTYFAYEKLGEMPDYVYKNWINLLKAYERLGGDDYIHVLAEKMKSWKLVKTDILDK